MGVFKGAYRRFSKGFFLKQWIIGSVELPKCFAETLGGRLAYFRQ